MRSRCALSIKKYSTNEYYNHAKRIIREVPRSNRLEQISFSYLEGVWLGFQRKVKIFKLGTVRPPLGANHFRFLILKIQNTETEIFGAQLLLVCWSSWSPQNLFSLQIRFIYKNNFLQPFLFYFFVLPFKNTKAIVYSDTP